MAYRSEIRLPLSETPTLNDPGNPVWPDLNDVYNSIHILAQLLDRTIQQGQSGDSSTPPWEAMPFTKWFYSQAAEDITAGNIVSMISRRRFQFGPNAGKYGVIKGVTVPTYNLSAGWSDPGTTGIDFIGMALEDCAEGDLCKVGVGPAIINVPGVNVGELVFCYRGTLGQEPERDGVLYTYVPQAAFSRTDIAQTQAFIVGTGVAKDAVMIHEHFRNPGIYVPAPQEQHTN